MFKKSIKIKFSVLFFLFIFNGWLLWQLPLNVQAAKLAPTDNLNDKINSISPKQLQKLPVYIFWGKGCPHCQAEKNFLDTIRNNYKQINFIELEVFYNKSNYQLFKKMARNKNIKANGVPATFIGDKVIIGFRNMETTGEQIKTALNTYLNQYNLKRNHKTTNLNSHNNNIIKHPFLGKIELSKLSLLSLTAILGTLDGFNPCSMWALVILITLLINSGSRKKLWLVGSIFILASALSYFLFLTAWLNAFLLIGYIKIVRWSIGILAIGVGLYFLYDTYKKREQTTSTCEVSSEKTKNKIIQKLEKTLHKKSLWAVIAGVIGVAFSVNLIELMCSAGIPAIYTQILSQNHLSRLSYYLYLIGYDFFYMLDDIIVLIIAGITWRLFQGTEKYVKYSHLIGGILILILGIIMIINPGLLSFK